MSSIIEKKKQIVKNIRDNINESKSLIFYDFQGVENREVNKMKKELAKLGANWKVYKNNLIKKAVTSFDSLDFAANNLKIEKANAIVFCRGDEYKPLKVLAKFNKKNNFIKKRFKYGFYENGLINANELEKLSKLPSKEVLINNLCYYLNFQVIRLTNVLEKIEK